MDCPVDCGYRIHQLRLCRGVTFLSTKCSDVRLNNLMASFQ